MERGSVGEKSER